MLVVDVSVAVKWFIPEEHSEFADAVLARIEVEGGLVPALFRWEIQSALLMAQRAHRLTRDDVDEAFDMLRDLPITIESVEGRIFPGSEVQLARHYDLTPYDAAYLAVAVNSRLPLATNDAELGSAARDLGIDVLTV